jgi:putative ABC transport system ATP-binding protein
MVNHVVELAPTLASTNRPPETVHVQTGEVLFEQCTMGDLIYVVSEGEFDIVRELADGGEELVKIAGPGEYFGEIGVLFHMPRSATVRARTDATAVGYTAQAFRERRGRYSRADRAARVCRRLAGDGRNPALSPSRQRGPARTEWHRG